MKFTLLLLCLLCGCASEKLTHGIPNFAVVDAERGIYRGGQPNAEGWKYLQSLKVNRRVKLNLEPDTGIPDRIKVFRCPITLRQQLGFDELWQATIGADWTYMVPGNCFVGCEHGQDRTGLIVAFYRVRVQGWSKADAEKEMLSMGFHRSLHGLWEAWENFKP